MLLELREISKTYSSGLQENGRKVLRGVSLAVKQGENLSIMGPSGSGKSTLLNIIGALDRPDSGEVIFNGKRINEFSEEQLAVFRNREIGFVFQSHHLLPQCSVIENILVPTLPEKDPQRRSKSSERAIALIKLVGLWKHKDNLPGTLSGGECQRVAVIRALINQPNIILADEPTGSLDRMNALSVLALLTDLNREFGTSLIVVTHSLEIGKKMDRSYDLIEGQLTLSDS